MMVLIKIARVVQTLIKMKMGILRSMVVVLTVMTQKHRFIQISPICVMMVSTIINCDGFGDVCALGSTVSWPDQQTSFGSALGFGDASRIAIGASGYDAQVQGGGAVFVHDDIEQAALMSIYAQEQASHLGTALGFSSDINEDEVSEWVLGLYGMDANGLDSGAVFLVGADQSGDVLLDDSFVHLTGQAAGDQFGWSLRSGGDLSGDGVVDIAVGAPRSDVGGADTGSVYLFHGPITETTSASSANLIIVGDEIGAMAGYSFDVQDINGDGDS